MRSLCLALLISACGSAHQSKRYYADHFPRIAIGECATRTSDLVSGPRPLSVSEKDELVEGDSASGIQHAGILGYAGSAVVPRPKDPVPDANGFIYGNQPLTDGEITERGPAIVGANNPLRGSGPKLAACLMGGTAEYAVLAVDLGFDAHGEVSSAAVYGVGDPTLLRCLETAARDSYPSTPNTTQRCGIALGSTTALDLPTLDLTADQIKWGGKNIATPADVVDNPEWKSAAITNAVSTWNAARADGIAVRGPWQLRPLGSTPMKIVERAMASSYAAGGNFVLATQRDGTWQPLRAIDLPVAPMPVGTGATWNGTHSTIRYSETIQATVDLTVLVRNNEIDVGLTAINDTFPIKGRDWAAVDRKIREYLGSNYLKDRHDIQIAADDDVAYDDVVHVVDIATAAGLTDWTVTDPARLANR